GQFAERGRGVKLMRLLMDAVSIQEKPSGNGTIVRLVKMMR
ncbi:MAG: anti-anti-sigma factor, partial [Lancefieldella parvula]|nr:anti-anti-sigma factor [Lancefieldella parvula]